jgi:hypothetical protein
MRIHSPTKKLNTKEMDDLFKKNPIEVSSYEYNGGLQIVYTSQEDDMKYTF